MKAIHQIQWRINDFKSGWAEIFGLRLRRSPFLGLPHIQKVLTLKWLKYTTRLKIKFVYEPSRPRRLKSFAFGFDKAEISAFRALTRHNFSEADQKVGGLEDTVAHPVLPIPTLMNIVIEIIRNEERLSQSLNLRMLKVKISSTCLFAL